MGCIWSWSCLSRDEDNLIESDRMSPMSPKVAIARKNNTTAICFFLDAATMSC
jgi:hypothetical protein